VRERGKAIRAGCRSPAAVERDAEVDSATKRCRGCDAVKPKEAFPTKAAHRDGRASWCRDCCARRRRERRQTDPQWAAPENAAGRAHRHATGNAARRRSNVRYPERRAARRTLWYAVKAGKVAKPDACERCGTPTPRKHLHGHHTLGYDRPLDVQWVCVKCHGREHRTVA
jgi:hypothetical protein